LTLIWYKNDKNFSLFAAVRGIHAEYLEAGAQILLTNTFGANRFKLSQHGLQDKLESINRAGVELARLAAGGMALVAGDIGPLGVRIAPFGRVQPEPVDQLLK
jgi:homocysteine S-methyltransferase